MKIPSSGFMANSGEGEKKVINSELWHACAGPLVSLPPVGSLVVYFPQGHSEQVAASMRKETDGIPSYPNLPSKLICMLRNVSLHADGETDEVYAQLTLQPASKYEQEALLVSEMGLKHSRQPSEFFCKTLTASDTSTHGGFSVPRRAAEKIFPPLDFAMQPPAQELAARDLHDQTWTFRHIYRGQPKRHLLTSGWSVFVNSKRLIAGDAVLFIRDERSHLLLGTRRANRQQPVASSSVISSDSMHIGILAAAAHAAANNTPFTVFYNPRACPSEFVIPLAKYNKAMYTQVTAGMRFRMMFETDESGVRRYMGTVNGVNDMDPMRWKNSLWRNLQVGWDESTAGERPSRVSVWEIEPVMAPLYMCPPPFFRPKLPKHPGFPDDNSEMENLFRRGVPWIADDLSSKDGSSSLFPGLSLVQWMSMQQHNHHHLSPNNNQSALFPNIFSSNGPHPGNVIADTHSKPLNVQSPAVTREPNNLQPSSSVNHSNDQIQQLVSNQNPHQDPITYSQVQTGIIQLHQNEPSFQKQIEQQANLIHGNQQQQQQQKQKQQNFQHQQQVLLKKQQQQQQQHNNASEPQKNEKPQPQKNHQSPRFSASNHVNDLESQPNQKLQPQQNHQTRLLESNHLHSSQFLDNRFLAQQRSPLMDRPHSIRADVDTPSCSTSPAKSTMQVEQTNFVRQTGLGDDLIVHRAPKLVQETHNSNLDDQLLHKLPNSKAQDHHKKYKGGAVIDHLDATSSFGSFPLTGFEDVQSHTRNSTTYTSTVEGWGPDALLSGGYDSGRDMHNLISNYNGTDILQTDLSSGTHSLGVPSTMPFNPGPSNDGVVNEMGDVNGGFWTNQAQRVRTYTKVQKRGSVGRTIDVTRYKGYDELRHDLARMFGMEGLLEDPLVQTEWKLVYVDHENDILLVGDDPWEEFVTCVQSIKILSSAEVQQMSLDGELGQTDTVQNQACSLSDSGNAWRGQYDNNSAASFNR